MTLNSDTIARLESQNNNSKYQLVYVKLDSALTRIIRSYVSRKKTLIFRAFNRWNKKTHANCIKANAITLIATDSLKAALKYTIRLYKQSKTNLVKKRLSKWLLVARKYIISKKSKEKFHNEVSNLYKAMEEKEEIGKVHNKTIHTLTSQISELNGTISKLKDELKKSEDLERSLKSKLDATRKREVQSKDEKMMQLKNQIAALEADNFDLRQKIENTESTVGAFINEMNELVDSQESALSTKYSINS